MSEPLLIKLVLTGLLVMLVALFADLGTPPESFRHRLSIVLFSASLTLGVLCFLIAVWRKP